MRFSSAAVTERAAGNMALPDEPRAEVRLHSQVAPGPYGTDTRRLLSIVPICRPCGATLPRSYALWSQTPVLPSSNARNLRGSQDAGPQSPRGQVLLFTPGTRYSPSRIGSSTGFNPRLRDLLRRISLGSHALAEARRLVELKMFGMSLRRTLRRAGDVLDAIDEVLVTLSPDRDHEAFAQVCALHRELESIQAQLPREYRRSLRRSL